MRRTIRRLSSILLLRTICNRRNHMAPLRCKLHAKHLLRITRCNKLRVAKHILRITRCKTFPSLLVITPGTQWVGNSGARLPVATAKRPRTELLRLLKRTDKTLQINSTSNMPKPRVCTNLSLLSNKRLEKYRLRHRRMLASMLSSLQPPTSSRNELLSCVIPESAVSIASCRFISSYYMQLVLL